MKKNALGAIVLVGAVISAGSFDATAYSPVAPRPGGGVSTLYTSNRIKIVHRRIEKLPLATVCVFARGGVLYENKNLYGVTALVQALLTKGTKTRSAADFAGETEKIGGAVSASTDKDFAVAEISVAKEHFDKAVELLSDAVLNPVFPKEEFTKEKAAVIASVQTRKDHIFTVADDLSNECLYGEYPYAVPETGTLETIPKINREDIAGWHRKLYTAGNIVISVAGDVTSGEALETVQKYFGAIAAGAPLAPDGGKSVRTKPLAVEKHDFRQAYLMISYPAPRSGEDDYPALKLLVGALGSRMSGRLFKELREKRSLAYEVNAFYPTRASDGRFSFYIGLDPSSIDAAEKTLSDIIKDVAERGLSETEMLETKKYLKGVWYLQRQTAARRAYFAGLWETMGLGAAYDDQYLENIMTVTADEARAAAKKYFDDGKAVTVKILPLKTSAE